MNPGPSLSVAGQTDEQLMARVQAGDSTAFGVLFDRHCSRALAVAATICDDRARSEDAVRAAFLTIWRSRSSFRPGRGSFRGWAMPIIREEIAAEVGLPQGTVKSHMRLGLERLRASADLNGKGVAHADQVAQQPVD